jgi:hypothetical protein
MTCENFVFTPKYFSRSTKRIQKIIEGTNPQSKPPPAVHNAAASSFDALELTLEVRVMVNSHAVTRIVYAAE